MERFADTKRALAIADSLLKLGFGHLVSELNMRWRDKLFARFKKQKPVHNLPRELTEVFGNLGGGFIKLGQLLSLRPDLVPREYCKAFRALQDRVHPLPFTTIKKILKDEYGQPGRIFKHIDEKPLGSASIAQVHKAQLQDGTRVVIKVMRPDIRKTITADIAIMHRLAKRLDKHYKHEKLSLQTIVAEFERYTQKELDFTNETEFMCQFGAYFTNNEHVRIPKVYTDHSSKRIVVTQYFPGKKLSQVDTSKAKVHAPFLARHLVDAFVDSVFDLGLFHGDLHPGNIIALRNGRIGLIDFGIVGAFTKQMQRMGLYLFVGLCDNDSDLVSRSLLKIAPPSPTTHVAGFKAAITSVMTAYRPKEHGFRLTSLLHRLLDIAVEHKLNVPADVVLLGKAAVTIEGTCLHLDSSFRFAKYMKPLIQKRVLKRKGFRSKEMVTRLVGLRSSLEEMGESFNAIVDRVKSGSLKVDIEDMDVRRLSMNIDRSSNRLAFALVTCAFVVAGALLSNVGPQLLFISFISWVMFLFSIITLASLVISIAREER